MFVLDAAPSFISVYQEKVLQPGPTISLTCLASGSPAPQITWKIDNDVIEDSYSHQINSKASRSGITSSTLNITHVTSQDGGLYSCEAKNTVGTIIHSKRINIYGAASVKKLKNVTAVSEADVLLNCRYMGYPIKSIKWYFGKSVFALLFNFAISCI